MEGAIPGEGATSTFMAWIKSHQSLKRHWKLHALADQLGISSVTAMGHLHALWYDILDYAPTGDLSRFTAGVIAKFAEWTGDPAVFFEALIACGWIDRGVDGTPQIHDWIDYCGGLMSERERKRKDAAARRERAPRSALRSEPRSAAREEKSREEKKREEKSTPPTHPLGGLLEKCISTLRDLQPQTNAKALHDAAERALKAASLHVEREVEVADRGDGRRGKVDLVVENVIGIEIDNQSARLKSVEKLQAFPHRIVLLRGKSRSVSSTATLDAVIGIADEAPNPRDLPGRIQPDDPRIPAECREFIRVWRSQPCVRSSSARDVWRAWAGAVAAAGSEDVILEDVRRRVVCAGWTTDPGSKPLECSYLNGRQWERELPRASPRPVRPAIQNDLAAQDYSKGFADV